MASGGGGGVFGAFMGQLDASIVTLTYVRLGEEFDAPRRPLPASEFS
ncbi:hypothetical protein ACWDT6_16530 [Nocardia grenadensis]